MNTDLIKRKKNLPLSTKSGLRDKRKESSDKKQIQTDVLAALRDGSHDAYAEVYLHYYKPLCDFLTALTRSREAAEDIAHDVFIAVWENRCKLDPGQGIQRYLYNIAKRQAMRYFRNRKRETDFLQHSGLQSDTDFTPEDMMAAKDIGALVETAQSQMPRIRGRIFGMHYDEELSYNHIADKLDMNKATVANHLTNAKKYLRKIIVLSVLAPFLRYQAEAFMFSDMVTGI